MDKLTRPWAIVWLVLIIITACVTHLILTSHRQEIKIFEILMCRELFDYSSASCESSANSEFSDNVDISCHVTQSSDSDGKKKVIKHKNHNALNSSNNLKDNQVCMLQIKHWGNVDLPIPPLVFVFDEKVRQQEAHLYYSISTLHPKTREVLISLLHKTQQHDNITNNTVTADEHQSFFSFQLSRCSSSAHFSLSDEQSISFFHNLLDLLHDPVEKEARVSILRVLSRISHEKRR